MQAQLGLCSPNMITTLSTSKKIRAHHPHFLSRDQKADLPKHFNYHAYIYATDDHPYRTATSGGAGIGSGLNTLANFDWIDFAREKWDTCSDASGSDCLTPKGFTFMRLIVEEGVYIDFYNLHADAGSVPHSNKI